MFFADVFDLSAGGFEDPQPQQAEHGDEREVVAVGRFPGGGQQRLELQVGEPEGRRFRAGTAGRRTCSAGECCRTPSTQVR